MAADAASTSSPTRSWFAPLFVARHHAETIDARVPCGRERTLDGAGTNVTLLATARDVVPWNALQVVRRLIAGLASWFSPFGWWAWGPRLSLPWVIPCSSSRSLPSASH